MSNIGNGQYKLISGTAAGTTVIKANQGQLYRVVLGNNTTGTVTLYDTNLAAGTTSANTIIALNNTSGTIPQSVEIGTRFKDGLTAVVGGTTNLTVIWD